jgi:hypothetical protein
MFLGVGKTDIYILTFAKKTPDSISIFIDPITPITPITIITIKNYCNYNYNYNVLFAIEILMIGREEGGEIEEDGKRAREIEIEKD